MLKLRKKGDKYWLFEDSGIGLFSPSKFTINLELNEIVIVYENGLKSKRYNVIDCEIYDLGATSPFTTSSGDLFMQKLEDLNCPCFQKNENIFNITGGNWGEIDGTLSDQTDLQTALDSKLDKVSTAGVERVYIINADGSQGTKATSDFKDVLEFTNLASFPVTGESGKIYVALYTNSTYRWTGSAYVEIGGGSETLLQVKGFATDFPIANLIGTSAPMSNINIASGTADYNRSLISTTETGHQGIVALRSSTNANSGFCFFYGGNIINNGDKHVSFFQFKLPTVTDVKGYVGFHASNTTAEPKSACFLEIVNNSGVFKTKGALLTTASTSFTLNTNTWYSLMIEFKSTTEVYFKIKLDDGTLVAEFTSTTNLPLFNTSAFTIVVNIFSTVATTARDLMLLDYVEYRPEKPNHLKSF